MRFGGLIAKRWPIVGGVLLVAGVALWVWSPWLPREREPVYRGQPLSHWLAMRSPPPPELLGMDPSNAAPLLVRALKRDSWAGAACYRSLLWPNLPAALKQHLPAPSPGNITVRGNAAFYFFHMKSTGPATNEVKRALIRALRQDDDRIVRCNVLRALGELGRADAVIGGELARSLQDKDRWVREAATNALLKLDP